MVTDSYLSVPETVKGYVSATEQHLPLEVMSECFLRTESGGADIAFLRVVGSPVVPHVLLSDAVAVGDQLWSFGHPWGGRFAEGQPTLLPIRVLPSQLLAIRIARREGSPGL